MPFGLVHERFGVTTDQEVSPDCTPDIVKNLHLKKNRELFYLVYHAVGETSPRPLVFNAQYGLFRVLVTMFGLLALVSLAGLGWALCCRPDVRLAFGVWSALYVAATFIAYFRCKKRAEDFARAVYDLFMTLQLRKPTPSGNESRTENPQHGHL